MAALPSQIIYPTAGDPALGTSHPKMSVQGRGAVLGLDTQQGSQEKGARTNNLALQNFWEETDSREWFH